MRVDKFQLTAQFRRECHQVHNTCIDNRHQHRSQYMREHKSKIQSYIDFNKHSPLQPLLTKYIFDDSDYNPHNFKYSQLLSTSLVKMRLHTEI